MCFWLSKIGHDLRALNDGRCTPTLYNLVVAFCTLQATCGESSDLRVLHFGHSMTFPYMGKSDKAWS